MLLPGQGRGPKGLTGLSRHLISAGYRVVLPEPRGFGESRSRLDGVTLRELADDVALAIRASGDAPVLVAGHAFGNRVARMLAATHTELVRGIVLLAAGGKFAPRPEVMSLLRVVQNNAEPLEQRVAAARAVLYGPKSSVAVEDMELDEVSADTIRAQTGDPARPVPIDSWWNGGTAPMLVIQGLSDVIAPPENGRSLAADNPSRVTLVEFADLGHGMTHERPDLLAETISTWAKTLST